MSDAALLRPGIAVGRYPQQEDIRDSWLDESAARIAGFFRQHTPRVGFRNQQFIAAVNAEASRVATFQADELRQEIRALRISLYAQGLEDELVARAFAIVCVTAERRIGLRPYDVQLYAGKVILQGKIAEMETGEGKTLTATLPACAAALAGIPVHIVTVNDFLVTRDAKWMGPVYKALGLSVGTITEGMSFKERREAYACDVTYCTNKQLVFDYLKDQIQIGQSKHKLQLSLEDMYNSNPSNNRLMLRGLCFAIVDEADSVLVDEARTPLIISNKTNNSQEEVAYRQAIDIAQTLTHPRDFVVKTREKRVVLNDFGKAQSKKLTRALGGVWRGTTAREDLICQALSALHLFERDKHYLISDGKVQIIDEYTGRVMPDRSWERGLHQMIETKENLVLTSNHETLSRISYQRFFRRYLHLAGMTGTAHEVTGELWSVYRASVQRIPTNKVLRRSTQKDQLYVSAEQRWKAVVGRVKELHRQGRPVLIGTRSVAASEHLSRLLLAASLPHKVLNASQNQEESKIISQAGQPGKITVATNMAGRGTDIRLAEGISELGGLHVLATERHEAGRIDRQLFGRCGRQGDAGSYQVILSLEDELLTDCYGNSLQGLVQKLFNSSKPLPRWFAVPVISWAQRSAERHHRRSRSDLLRIDEKLGDLMAFAGNRE
jgi:preprotein translocase subunit SecA